MAIDRSRREGLKLLCALPLSRHLSALQPSSLLLVGSCKFKNSRYGVAAVNAFGHVQWTQVLPARAHDVIVQHNFAYVFARKPGNFIAVIDCTQGHLVQLFRFEDSLSINGHGAINPLKPNQLVVSAAKADTQMACLHSLIIAHDGCLHAESSWALNLYEPHDLEFHGSQLWLACGGRVSNTKLAPSLLVQLDWHSRTLKNSWASENPELSLRHLSIHDSGEVALAAQYSGEIAHCPPLLYRCCTNGQLTPVKHALTFAQKCKGYLGEVKWHDDNIVVSSARAHWLGIFKEHSVESIFEQQVCGIAVLAKQHRFTDQASIWFSSGSGGVINNASRVQTDIIWDNHWAVTVV